MTARDLRQQKRPALVALYKQHGGNKSKLAAALGVSRQTLHDWIRGDAALARALMDVDRQVFEDKLKKARTG
jgi:transposase-like protein